jgi:thiosulfate/3-mercaptopyruvate sulfurtransferase
MLVDAAHMMKHQSDPAAILVAFMPGEDFANGHIPGSIQLDWPAFEVIDTSDASIDQWRDETNQMLASLDITRNRPVIAYDAGTLFAARMWWILHYLGHENSHVLNGGLPAWRQADGVMTTDAGSTPLSPTPVSEPGPMSPRTDALAQLDEVLGRLEDPEVAIIDARTPDEYKAGHIPGAININYPRNAAPEPPRFWKSANELRAMYEEAGITPDQRVIPYCSTGVRSAVTFFTLRLIGYQNVGLFTGSWKEWGDQPNTPKVVGDQP